MRNFGYFLSKKILKVRKSDVEEANTKGRGQRQGKY
jgi:hypothetical protein